MRRVDVRRYGRRVDAKGGEQLRRRTDVDGLYCSNELAPRTNWKSLAAYEFALPPLDEQRRIVEALQAIGQVSATLFRLLTSMRVAQSAIFESQLNSRNARATPLGDLLLRSPQNGCSAPVTSDPTGHWVLALSAISRWGYVPGQLTGRGVGPRRRPRSLLKGHLP